MEHQSFVSLMVVVGMAFFVPIVLHQLKLKMIPVVVAEILTGVVIGKSGFDIIHQDQWLSLLSTLGFIYLMFLSGLEIDFNVLKQKRKTNEIQPIKAAIRAYAGVLGLSFLLSYILHWFGLIEEPLFLTLVISTVSLGIVLPVLKGKGLLQTNKGQTILLIAVLADFVSMIFLAVFVAVKSDEGQVSALMLLLVGAFFLVYHFAKPLISFSFFDVLKKGTVQLGIRGVFALVLFFVVLSESLGVESILGAFLAGIMVSLLAPNEEFKHQLDSFGYGFLIPIFFVMVGVELDIWTLFQNKETLLLMPILLVVMFSVKIIPMILLKKHFSWAEILGSGALLTSTLSLMIAAVEIALQLGIVTEDFGAALILVSVVICLIAPIGFSRVIFPIDKKKETVVIIGVNRITLPVSLDLNKAGYDICLIGQANAKLNDSIEATFPHIHIDDLSYKAIASVIDWEAKTMVIATKDNGLNEQIGREAQKAGVRHVVIRIESAKKADELTKEGYTVFSTLSSTQVLVKALIQQKGIVEMLKTNQNIKEVRMRNSEYDFVTLRNLPHLGGVLVMQIIRNEENIVPHGDTFLRVGDRLIVSGTQEEVVKFKEEMS